MTNPVSSDAKQNGTAMYHPVNHIAKSRPRRIFGSEPACTASARVRKLATAPSQPTEAVVSSKSELADDGPHHHNFLLLTLTAASNGAGISPP